MELPLNRNGVGGWGRGNQEVYFGCVKSDTALDIKVEL